jgi:tetratricopeptide (TPR) repeat protein
MRLLVLLLVVPLLSFAANPKATALAKDADRLYKENKYREAAALLKQAYDVEANPLYLYNIARAWDQAGELESALDTYRQYVGLPSDTTTPELVKKANLAMDRLRTLVARGEADKKVNDAEKKRLEDDKAKAESRAEQEARVAAEQKRAFDAKERAARESQQSTLGTRKLVSLIVGGVGVVSLGTSLVFALLANGSRNAFRVATTLNDKTLLEGATRGQALACDLTLLVGVAAAVTAVVLFPRGDQPVSLLLGPTQGGAYAGIGGTF